MDRSEVIAERFLIFVSPEGKEILSSVQIGAPYANDDHGTCCDFEVPNVVKRRYGAGVDGIQALLLTMSAVWSHLDLLVSRGWKMLWPDTRDETTTAEIFESEHFARMRNET